MKKQLSTLGKAAQAERRLYHAWLGSGAKEAKGILSAGSEQRAFDAWRTACQQCDELMEVQDEHQLASNEAFYLSNDPNLLDEEHDLPW